MKKAIEITEMRISSNGQHLEFIIECPLDYQFTKFTIQVNDEDDEYSIAESLFYDEDRYITSTDNRFVGQVPVELFGVTEPAIYTIHLEAEHTDDVEHTDEETASEDAWNNNNSLKDSECNPYPQTIYADAYISDVSHAYDCLIDDIVAFDTSKCADSEVQDRVIRNYLILYAHQEALHLGYIDEATKWFRMIQQCFTGKCGGGKDRNGKYSGCGCGKSLPHYEMPKPHNDCGCRR